jgi:hypothetical protein
MQTPAEPITFEVDDGRGGTDTGKVTVTIGVYSSADSGVGDDEDCKPNDYKICLSEMLRVVQIYNMTATGAYHCDPEGEDGYNPGDGDQKSCDPHTSDYNPKDWKINLSELLRMVQFYTLRGYHALPDGVDDEEGDGLLAGPE